MARLFFAALMLVVASCASAQNAAPMAATPGDFVFKDMKGQVQRLSSYRGKWVLLNFWATWCPPCLREVPDLISLHDAHKDKDLVVIGVALDSTKEAVQRFVAKHRVTYPVVIGDYKQAEQVGNIEGLPTTYLFDPSGKVAATHTGALTRSGVEEFIHSGTSNKTGK